MRKTQIHWLIVGLLLLGVFNFLFFWLNTKTNIASVWVSYVYIHLAYVQLIAVPFLIPKSKSTHLFIEAISAISAAYFLFELVLGVLFVILALESWKLVFLVQFVLLLADVLILYINVLANNRTANNEVYKKEVQKILKSARAYLKQAIELLSGEEKKLLEDACDELAASPLIVDESLRGIETNILSESKEVLQNAQGGNVEAVRKRIAILNSMIALRKQAGTR